MSAVKKAKRALSLAQSIVRDIEAGRHNPGDRLPREDEMLARYEVARATLREALRCHAGFEAQLRQADP